MLAPADRAVSDLDQHVVMAERLKPPPSRRNEIGDPLDGENALGALGEDRGLIPGPRTDLEHALLAAELERLAHRRDHVRLRDRLLLADRQRLVEIGSVAPRLFPEEVSLPPL